MKKILFKISKVIAFTLTMVMFLGMTVSAKTVTVQTASFTTYPMQYYDENTSHWHIAEEAVYDNTCLEYLCVHNIAQLTPNKNYAAIKAYQLESDADFYFEGNVELHLPDYLFEGEVRNQTTVNFFVASDKGKIIYPSDGTNYLPVTLASKTIKVSGEASGLSAGDKIYFVAFTDSEIAAPYLTAPISVWETPYGGYRGVPVNDTNSFSEEQGEMGWEFLFAPIDTLEFGSKEVTYDEYAEVGGEDKKTDDKKAQSSNVVISTGNTKPLPTEAETKEALTDAKLMITALIILAALILILQAVVFEVIRNKKGKEVESGDKNA